MKAKREVHARTTRLLLILLFAWTSQAALVRVQGEYEQRAPFPLSSHRPLALTYESVKSKECREHSRTFLKDLKELKMWALKMHDANGKVSSGVLRGNVHWLGDETECFSVSSKPGAEADDKDNIRGQYCSVGIYVEPNPKQMNGDGLEDIYDLIHSHNLLRNNHDERVIFYPSFSPMTLGVCIPHSCTTEDLKAGMSEWLMSSNDTAVDINLQVSPAACLKDHHNKLHPMAIFTLTFYAVMTLIGIAGSFYEANKEKRKQQGVVVGKEGKLTQVFLAFSFRSNMKDLFDTSTPMDEIGCLHGIRAIFSLTIYILHKWFFFLHTPIANREDTVAIMTGPQSMILRAMWNHVDTFVIMSGLLTSYYAVKKLQEGRKLNIIKMYLQRYVKFTPLFFVGVLWVAHVFEYMVTDSHYLRTTRCFSDSCKDAWLNTITYTNTFRGLDDICFPPAHQLETDMQMYLLAPFLVLLLWELKLTGVAVISLSMIALSFYKYYTVVEGNLATIIYYGQSKKLMTDSANILYLNFSQRLVPYFFGILLGYLLRVRNREYKLPWLLLMIGNAAALYSAYYNFFGLSHSADPGYVYDVEENAMFGTIQPITWACAMSWFIYTCASGQSEMSNRLLRWKGFMVTSRLSFAFYLSQIPVIMVQVGRNPMPNLYSILSIFDLNCFVAVLVVTTWLTLLFLIPVGKLWNIFAGQAQHGGKETKKE